MSRIQDNNLVPTQLDPITPTAPINNPEAEALQQRAFLLIIVSVKCPANMSTKTVEEILGTKLKCHRNDR